MYQKTTKHFDHRVWRLVHRQRYGGMAHRCAAVRVAGWELAMPASSRNRFYPFFCRTFITASRHRCGTFRWCFTSCVIWWNSRSTVGSWFVPGLRSSTGSSSGSPACAFAIDLKAGVTSFSVGLTLRSCMTGHWGNPSMMSSLSMSDFA